MRIVVLNTFSDGQSDCLDGWEYIDSVIGALTCINRSFKFLNILNNRYQS